MTPKQDATPEAPPNDPAMLTRAQHRTDQGGGKRRVGLATIAYSWPPLVELGGAWRNT
jgi:hypothetical protein